MTVLIVDIETKIVVENYRNVILIAKGINYCTMHFKDNAEKLHYQNIDLLQYELTVFCELKKG